VIADRVQRAALVLVSVLLLASCDSAQRSLMYFPSQELPSPQAAGVPEMAVVRLETDDGLALVSWYAGAGEPGRPTIVYFQGNAGNIADRARKVRPFLDRGYGVLLVGYRGYGGNPGVPGEEGLAADGRAALGFLAARGVLPEQVVLLGESLGGAVAVRLASERSVGAVILEAPFTSAVDAAGHNFPLLPVTLFIEDPYDSLARIDRIGAPLLIVHGERDEIVPADQGRRLLAAARAPKQGVFLPDAGHNDLYFHGSNQIAIAFLERFFGE
jgi:fermentation-respiration switch protein FrsA (DUF1100 family)